MHMMWNANGGFVKSIDNDVYLDMLFQTFLRFKKSNHDNPMSTKVHHKMICDMLTKQILSVYRYECLEIKYAMRGA